MKYGVLRVRLDIFILRGHLKNGNFVQRPSMRGRYPEQFFLGLGERDVQAFLAVLRALQEKLQGQGGLAGAGIAFHQIKVAAGKTSEENVIQPLDTGFGPGRLVRYGVLRGVHPSSSTVRCVIRHTGENKAIFGLSD